MMNSKTLTLELVFTMMDASYDLIFVDYDDNLDDCIEVIEKCIRAGDATMLYEQMDNWYADAQGEALGEIVSELRAKCVDSCYNKEEVDSFFEANDEPIRDQIYQRDSSDPIRDLLRNSSPIPVRVELYSNYDCMNSHWFETSNGGYWYKNSYFGDMIDALNLNPKKVQKMLHSHGIETFGNFYSKRYREGNELVDYEQLYQELINSCTGANLLVFAATLDPIELYENNFKIDKITIPAGNYCGLFSSAYGGGSLLEMELKRDFTVDLNKHGKTEYDNFGLILDHYGNKYSIIETYGMCSSFFKKSLKIIPDDRSTRC